MKRRCAIGKRRVMQMKKRLLCFTMLLTVTISAITFTNNVKAATKWNTSKSVTKEENGIKYSAYLTEDGKEMYMKLNGLKRFIRDFGNFNDKSLREIIIWEDYLLYAIILNESKSLKKEIVNDFGEDFS